MPRLVLMLTCTVGRQPEYDTAWLATTSGIVESFGRLVSWTFSSVHHHHHPTAICNAKLKAKQNHAAIRQQPLLTTTGLRWMCSGLMKQHTFASFVRSFVRSLPPHRSLVRSFTRPFVSLL